MKQLFAYRDELLYCHHTLDSQPHAADFAVHAHEMMEIYYIIAGAGTFLVEGTHYTLQPGDVLLMRPAETHKLQICETLPYERIAIHFDPKLVHYIDPDGWLLRPFTARPLGQLNQYGADALDSRSWAAAFQQLQATDSANVRAHVIARLISLLPALCDAYDRRRGEIVPQQGAAGQLVAYVNEHLFEDLSVSLLAAAFYRSPSQINRLFRQATGTSLKQFVSVKRLLAARAMLQRGERAGDVCSACGFNDYSAFFRAYKRQFFESPSADMMRQSL